MRHLIKHELSCNHPGFFPILFIVKFMDVLAAQSGIVDLLSVDQKTYQKQSDFTFLVC